MRYDVALVAYGPCAAMSHAFTSSTLYLHPNRDCSMRFLNSGLLHKSTVPGPLSNILKYIRKYFRFHRDIHENIFDFRVTIPGSQENDP